jgi:hypothetical protein
VRGDAGQFRGHALAEIAAMNIAAKFPPACDWRRIPTTEECHLSRIPVSLQG